MPGEFGTFLALTGTEFSGSDAKELLGLAEFLLTPSEELLEILSNNSHLIDNTISAIDLYDSDGIRENVDKYRNERLIHQSRDKVFFERKHRKISDDRFVSPWEAKENEKEESADRVDIRYRDFLRENAYAKFLYDTVKLGSGTTGYYLNHYAHVADFIKSLLPTEAADLNGSMLRKYEKDINRCFWPDSIEEIKENLRKENTKFAQYCLDKLEKNDNVSLNLTLSLLRQATKLSYSECLHLEMKGMINLLKNEHQTDLKTPMTKDLINEYFKTPEEYKYVDLKV